MAPWGPWGRGGLLPSWGPCLQSSQRTWQDRAWTSTEHRQPQKSRISERPLPPPRHFCLGSFSCKAQTTPGKGGGGPGPPGLAFT